MMVPVAAAAAAAAATAVAPAMRTASGVNTQTKTYNCFLKFSLKPVAMMVTCSSSNSSNSSGSATLWVHTHQLNLKDTRGPTYLTKPSGVSCYV
jgi:hypothetical protein